MAAAIPASMKAADIARFAQRAGQVEKAKPVIAYWCNYWIVEQILSRGLHQADDESKSYTMHLMDKLEQMKSDFKDHDAIADDMAGQAFVEQFGIETFQRADNAMKANKVSRQTADTFMAAATFLELCQIWGPMEPETASKIKFAKYHSVRILKAIKASEDPNLSNPVLEPKFEERPLDPNDPEVQMLNGSSNHIQTQNINCQPSVVEVADEHDLSQGQLAQRSTYDESLHPSRAPSVPPQPARNDQLRQDASEHYYNNAEPQPEVSPLAPSSADRTMSEGGGYFPNVSNTSHQPRDPAHYTHIQDQHPSPPEVLLPDASSLPPPSSRASGFHTSLPPPSSSLHSFPPPGVDNLNASPPVVHPTPDYTRATSSAPRPSHPSQPITAPRDIPQPSVQPYHPTSSPSVTHPTPARSVGLPEVTNQAAYVADEDAILKAQKHARWAISALNFEDVNTAVKELRGALESLGAS